MIFTQIPEKLKYEPAIRGKLSSMHSDIIVEVSNHFRGRFSDKKQAVKALNVASYLVITKDSSIENWDVSLFLQDVPHVPDELCKSTLGRMYVSLKDVVWDIDIVEDDSSTVNESENHVRVLTDTEVIESKENRFQHISDFKKETNELDTYIVSPTPKSDLYLQPPTIPKFDYSKIWMSKQIGDTTYCIYSSLPEVPTKQNEISVTTDISRMSDRDIRNLYPNIFIRTRPTCMYDHIPGIMYHNLLGCVIPIEGFTREQVIDNMVKYPHIFRLTRNIDGTISTFYSSIEIDGELYPVSDYWKNLPESESIPYNVDFVKEYVVRRYLLERDINHVKHKYPIVEDFKPFLTLFMPISDYIRLGYSDIERIGKMCVSSRVAYKRSKNPVIRRIEESNV